MKKEIQLIKQKADSTTFIIKQIELLEARHRKIVNAKRQMELDNIYIQRQFDILNSELSTVNSQIEQYESQIKAL